MKKDGEMIIDKDDSIKIVPISNKIRGVLSFVSNLNVPPSQMQFLWRFRRIMIMLMRRKMKLF